MNPMVYEENTDSGLYFESIRALGDHGANREGVDYPSIDHLLYIYLTDYIGSGNPGHSLLVDIKYEKAYYSINLEFLTDGYWSSNYTEVDLSQTDINAITQFSSVQGILDWKDDYHTDKGETQWLISMYFDDGSYFQSGGEYYPDEYEELENDIWPLLSDKSGEELWWMRGRP